MLRKSRLHCFSGLHTISFVSDIMSHLFSTGVHGYMVYLGYTCDSLPLVSDLITHWCLALTIGFPQVFSVALWHGPDVIRKQVDRATRLTWEQEALHQLKSNDTRTDHNLACKVSINSCVPGVVMNSMVIRWTNIFEH